MKGPSPETMPDSLLEKDITQSSLLDTILVTMSMGLGLEYILERILD
jgi:hypothetical protein